MCKSMERKKVDIWLCDSYLDGPMLDTIEKLQDLYDQYTAKGMTNLRIDSDENTLNVRGSRPETDEEFNNRMKKEEALRKKAIADKIKRNISKDNLEANKEAKERELLKQLKDKYEKDTL